MKKIFIIHILLAMPLLAWCDNITFADAEVKAICVKNWDTNYDGELSYEEAEKVRILYGPLGFNKNVKSFDEFQYFTNVYLIGASIFSGCENLSSIILPKNLEDIGSSAFAGCYSLASITFPNSVKRIYSDAFRDCHNLSSITIPNSVSEIQDRCFWGCTSLSSITIPSSVTSIGFAPFYGCNSLASIVVENGNPKYDSRNNCNAIIEKFSNKLIFGCKNTIIPNSVTSIGDNAFAGCYSLTSVTIPNSVTSIGDHAFYQCSSLTSVTIPNSVTSIGGSAFKDCSSLTSVTIPNSVTSIGGYAFEGCSGLTSVHISDLEAWCNITFTDSFSNPLYFAHHLYLNGDEVKDLVIPNSVTSIGSSAFEGCSSLTSVTIPNSVKTIGQHAFRYCSGLTSIAIPNSVETLMQGAFSRCTGLTSISFGNSLQIIGAYAFDYSESLVSVTIPNSVTSIGEGAFDRCGRLVSVTIPNSVTEIGNYAFRYCSSLTSVNIPNSVTSISSSAFRYCSSLTSVNIPNSVTSIGERAFSDCSSLTSVTIPNSVTSIGAYAFNNCRRVKVKSTEPSSIEYGYYPPFRSYTTIYVPKGYKDAYLTAEKWNSNRYTFIEYPNSDVNQDGVIDVVDVVDIARYVVGTPSTSFDEFLADLNSDDLVNVADAVVLVNEIAGNTSFAKAWHVMQSSDDVQEQLMLTKNNDNSLSLRMENSRTYTAFQFDLMMNGDVNVMQMLLNDSRKNDHQLLYNKVGDGHYRVAVLSTTNNSFNGNSGELLNIQLDGFDTDDLTIHNVHFFTGKGNDYAFDDLKLQGGTTTINELPLVDGDQPAAVYDLQGRKQPTLRRGVNIMNGKKVIIK